MTTDFTLPPPETAFAAESTVLGTYTFLPYVRTGLAAAARGPEPGGTRASVEIVVPVQAPGQPDVTATYQLRLRGPADVRALVDQQIVRRYPEPGATSAETTHLVHVEFDSPEALWQFTPLAPDGERLAPWLALVVLREGRYRPGAGQVPTVLARYSELQALDDSWAWAHAQIHGPIAGPAIDDRLSAHFAPTNLSRLMCPRRLEPFTRYLACVVPAFDAGRRAALNPGDETGTLEPAWRKGGDDEEIELPVLHSWRFDTGEGGDFGMLAGKLVPSPAPWQVGRRLVDTSRPWGDLFGDEAPAIPSGQLQLVRGPLVSPIPPRAASDDPAEAAAARAGGWPAEVTGELRDLLLLPTVLARKPGAHEPGEPLPLCPPVYAGSQAGSGRLVSAPATAWLPQLNLDPANRIVAALGARVVQRDQEQLMQSAWAQVGRLGEVNQWLRQAQLARAVRSSMFARHLSPLGYGDLLQIGRPVQDAVPGAENGSARSELAASSTAPMASTQAFRRVVRRTSPADLLAPGDVPRDFQRPYDDGEIARLSQLRVVEIARDYELAAPPDWESMTAEEFLAWWDEWEAMVLHCFWPMPDIDPDFDIEQWAAEQALDVLQQAMPSDPEVNPELAAGLLGDIAAVAEVGGQAGDLAGEQLATVTEQLGLGPGDDAVAGVVRHGGVSDDLLAAAGRQHLETADLADAARTGARTEALAGAAQSALTETTLAGIAREHAATETLARAATTELGVSAGLDTGVRAEMARAQLPTGALARLALDLHPDVLAEAARTELPDTTLAELARLDLDTATLAQLAKDRMSVAALADLGRAHLAPATRARLAVDSAGITATEPLKQALQARIEPRDIEAAMQPATGALVSPDWQGTPIRPAYAVAKDQLLTELDPDRSTAAQVAERLRLPGWVPGNWFDGRPAEPIMAAPRFDRPMYQALEDYDPDWLIAGTATLDEPDLVTTLVSNAVFLEAFFAGLSHEMARELLWRGYPTDQRGTYFRRFWGDHHGDELTGELHLNDDGPLGSHISADLDGRLVMLVRGELIRRYPDTVALALRGGSPETGDTAAPLLFQRRLRSGALLAGFDLTVTEVRDAHSAGTPWWFVLAEHPTAPRFGPGESAEPFLTPPVANAAGTARALLQQPVRAAFDIHDLLGPMGAG
ncbi:hypothetical protein [Amycolatopsis sacchari]|uniref:Uncharacterized protein n=1 Tax=Amycolatopsis sacchari TaxID=115433 RepID=A0A1I4BPJ0_9PSEU|nr:hypothetical protein [Amycolatopsis sacchari]SFK70310.1 hypothetical protein SAMN05421835_12968 [Amycolatopsis sacchari]